MAKKGRKSRPPYQDSDGGYHTGLYCRPDGRFDASGNPNKTLGISFPPSPPNRPIMPLVKR